MTKAQDKTELAPATSEGQPISLYSSSPVPVGELEAKIGFSNTDKSINNVRIVRAKYAPGH